MSNPRLAGLLTFLLPLLALADSKASEAPIPCGRGLSAALKACIVAPSALLKTPKDLPQEGEARWVATAMKHAPVPAELRALRAPEAVGIWRLETAGKPGAWKAAGLEVITARFHDGRRADLNGYLIGRHPGKGRKGAYQPPEWFIEVTRENQDFAVSENFRLGQFLTKDQRNVWPKYVPLNPNLVDKLERIVQELRKEGFAARKVHVMSGYRTPRYNGPGGKGRAKFSRHTYGDAADIWVDDDGDGMMDDLNRDGRLDDGDAEYLVTIVDRVERAHPELVGGAGIYKANRAHGPFTHVDVRGRTARWSRR